MKGIVPLIAIAVVLVIAVLFISRPASIQGDSNLLPPSFVHRVQAAPVIDQSFIVPCTANLQNTGLEILNAGRPTFMSATVKAFPLPDGRPTGEVTLKTATFGDLSRFPGSIIVTPDCEALSVCMTNDAGVQNILSPMQCRLDYHIILNGIVTSTPIPTPISSPVPGIMPVLSTPQQSGRIPVISDIIDGVGSLITAIIAFIAVPFIPPAP